jgi:hypothetical protein
VRAGLLGDLGARDGAAAEGQTRHGDLPCATDPDAENRP